MDHNLVILWEYIILFVLAATPWLEVLIVIPIGIAAGLNPLPVAIVTFTGNAIPVLVIVFFHEKWERWREERRQKNVPASPEKHHAKESRRKKFARKIWNRYGLPGLALIAPGVTGIHLATVMALALGSPRTMISIWMNISLVLWTIGITVIAFYGFALL